MDKNAKKELARALAYRANDPSLSVDERESALAELRELASGSSARGSSESRLVTAETR